MLKELLFSFKDEFQEKSHNPFIWTYFFVWCIRNWPLVYSLFNFDDGTTLQSKVAFISCYFEENPFLKNVGYNILYTLALLPVSFLLLNISRFIVIFSEKTIKSWVYKVTDKGSVVLKSEHSKVLEKLARTIEDLGKEKEKVEKLDSKIKSLENEKNGVEINDEKEYINRLINEIKRKKLNNIFIDYVHLTRRRQNIPDSANREFFTSQGLFRMDHLGNLTITDDGEKIYKIISNIESQKASNIQIT